MVLALTHPCNHSPNTLLFFVYLGFSAKNCTNTSPAGHSLPPHASKLHSYEIYIVSIFWNLFPSLITSFPAHLSSNANCGSWGSSLSTLPTTVLRIILPPHSILFVLNLVSLLTSTLPRRLPQGVFILSVADEEDSQ